MMMILFMCILCYRDRSRMTMWRKWPLWLVAWKRVKSRRAACGPYWRVAHRPTHPSGTRASTCWGAAQRFGTPIRACRPSWRPRWTRQRSSTGRPRPPTVRWRRPRWHHRHPRPRIRPAPTTWQLTWDLLWRPPLREQSPLSPIPLPPTPLPPTPLPQTPLPPTQRKPHRLHLHCPPLNVIAVTGT